MKKCITKFLACIILTVILFLNFPSSVYADDLSIPENESPYKSLVPSALSINSQSTSNGSPTSILGYHNLSEVNKKLHNIAQSYPNIARVYNLGNLYPHANGTPKRTVQNRSVYALKISDNPSINESSEPDLLYLGLHHAREWITVEALLYFLDYVINNYQTNNTINKIVNNNELWLVPVVNPDGFNYSQYGRDDINNSNGNQWRKNCNETNGVQGFQDSGWAQGDGVDLNRNYGYKWGYDNSGSSPNPNNHLYRGTAPFSEVETQLIRDLSIAMQFKLALSFHSYSQLILFPWAYDDYDTPHDTLFNEIAKNMSQYNGYIYGNPKDGVIYNCNGETDDWLYANLSCLAFTIELGTVFIPPPAQILPICQKNLEPCILIAKLADDPYEVFNSGINGQVTTSYGEPLSGVNISTSFAGDSISCITNATGHYTLRLPPGTFSLYGAKEGYWLRLVNDVPVQNDKFTIKDFTMIDNQPPVISSVWAEVGGVMDNTFELGSMIRIKVTEKYNEANLTGTINIASNSQDYSSGNKKLKFDNTTNNYTYLWNTSILQPGDDYIIETTLKDIDFNIDANGSNDTGPDLILSLVDETPPMVSLVDTILLGSALDADENYELGTTVRLLVYEQNSEKWLNGTVSIESKILGYSSGLHELIFDKKNNYYYYDWSTKGLTPADDYAIETTLRDKWGNVDLDGLPNTPDITVTLVDTTPPVISDVDSFVGIDTDEVYEQGLEVIITVRVQKYEPGLSGFVNLSSASTGYEISLDELLYDNIKNIFYVYWDTANIPIANDYVVEVAMADSYLNYDSDGAVNNGPDLTIRLVDRTPPIISEVKSFVGQDNDNEYELGSIVCIVITETNNEQNLTGTVKIQSRSKRYNSGELVLFYDSNLIGYIFIWNTSEAGIFVSDDYSIETKLSDKFGNTDYDGLPTSPDLTISLVDTTPPEIVAVWSYAGDDKDNRYACGTSVVIVIEERIAEPWLHGTIHIKSEKSSYDSNYQDIIWDSTNENYIYTWDTEGLEPSDDYSIETTLMDGWTNIDTDGLPATPDLVITLLDVIPPESITGLIAYQDPNNQTKIELSWFSPEPNVKLYIYRSNETITEASLSDLEPITVVTGNNHNDSLPNNPGTYYYVILIEDSAGNLNSNITPSNSVRVTLTSPEPEDTDRRIRHEKESFDLFWFWLLGVVIIITLVFLGFLVYFKKKQKDQIKPPETSI